MRRSLVAAVALAPLCLAAGAASAQSTDTVSSSVTTPIATATALNGGPADIDVTGSVSISSASSTPVAGSSYAVLLNSNNSVTNTGSVNGGGVNNSAAILALGGYTGNVSSSGSITNTDSFSATTNGDGYTEEPFSTAGSTGRYGIRLAPGTGALTGSIISAGTITVNGNSSSGISIEAPLTNTLTNSGTISVTGDNSTGIRSLTGATINSAGAANTLAGAALITGNVTVLGQNSSAINLQGDVDGRLSIYSTVSATGYASINRPGSTSTLESIQATAGTTNTQVGQSAGALIVGGNVTGGILIGAPPVGTTTSTAATVDKDADGVADYAEGSGIVVNYGSAPGLTLGSATQAITIGEVGTTDTETAADGTTLVPQPANAYGLIIRGAVSGVGVYDGVSATGLQIGTTSGQAVNVAGGVRIVGSVAASSYEAAATTIQLNAGANVPVLRNEGYLEATINHSAAVATSTAAVTATVVNIGQGATLGALTNYSTIQATANGDYMNAKAIVDASGTLSSVTNEGVIVAGVTPVTTCQPGACSTVALDLSKNTSGISLLQQVNPNPLAVDVTTTTSSTGVVSTTSAISTATATTTTTTTTTTAGVTTTTTTTTPTYPEIIGDVLLGSGTNTVQILGGSVTGALSLGGGTNDVLTVDGGAIVTGPLTNVNATTGAAGTGLALTVNNGSLFNTATGTLNLSTLNIGSKGALYAAIDPANNANTLYNASGTATIASGGQLGIILRSPLTSARTFTIVQAAGGLDSAAPASSLLTSDVPYLITGTAVQNTAAGTISVDLAPRTAAQMGLNPAESAALSPVLASLSNDAAISNAVLGTYTRANFLHVYDQLLPDYAGGTFQLALAASDSVTRATARVNDIQNPSGTRGAWTEEVAFGVNRSAGASAAGYQGGGFGVVGGVETGGLGLGAFGLTGAFLTGDVKDPHSPGDNLSSFSEGEGGAYWQGQLGGFRGDARVAGGYMLYSERRELLLTNSSGATVLDRSAKGNSSGYSLTGHFGLGYQTPQFGWFYFRPQVHGDYFRLQQNAYTERYGGDGFDLTLGQRVGNASSGTASLVTGMTFGSGFQWRPELEIGYRDVFSGTAGDTVAQFANGSPFSLPPAAIRGGGPVGRVDVKADTDFYELNFEAGAEQRLGLVSADARISVRVLF